MSVCLVGDAGSGAPGADGAYAGVHLQGESDHTQFWRKFRVLVNPSMNPHASISALCLTAVLTIYCCHPRCCCYGCYDCFHGFLLLMTAVLMRPWLLLLRLLPLLVKPTCAGPCALQRHTASDLQRRWHGLHVPILLDANDTVNTVAPVGNELDGRGGS